MFDIKADSYRKILEAERAAREAQDKATIELLHNLKSRYDSKIKSYMAKNKKKKGKSEPSADNNDGWDSRPAEEPPQPSPDNNDGWDSRPVEESIQPWADNNDVWGSKPAEEPSQPSPDNNDNWDSKPVEEYPQPSPDNNDVWSSNQQPASTHQAKSPKASGDTDENWDTKDQPASTHQTKKSSKASGGTDGNWGTKDQPANTNQTKKSPKASGGTDENWDTKDQPANTNQTKKSPKASGSKKNLVNSTRNSDNVGEFTTKDREDLLRKLNEANQERDALKVKARGLTVDFCSAKEEVESHEKTILYLTQRNSRLEAELIHSKNLIRTLKDSCAFVESQAKTFEVRHDTVVMSKADMERELINIKEESSRHITTINRLQKSNEKLSRAFIQSAEAHDQTRAELEMFQRESARRLLKFKEENDRLVVQNNQLTKLIDLINKKR